MSKDGVNTTARSNGLIEHIKKRRTLIVALSAVIVFATVYALILPAITLDKETAGKQGGIDVVTEQSADTDAQAQEADQNKAKKEDQKVAAARGQLLHEGKGYSLKAAYGEKAGLPEDTELEVEEVTDKDKEYQAWYDETLKALQESKGGSDIAQLTIAKFYDISLTANGDTLAPEAPVDVTITYDKSLKAKDADKLRIVHFIANKDGSHKAEILDSDKVEPKIKEGELTKVSFEAEAFSMYAVAYAEAGEDADEDANKEADEEAGDKDKEKDNQKAEDKAKENNEEKETTEETETAKKEDADVYRYRLEEGAKVRLSKIFEAAGIEAQVKDVEDVTSGDETLVNVKNKFFGSDWTVQAMMAFDDAVSLTAVLKDGETIEIQVTGAPAGERTLTKEGKNYTIDVMCGDIAGIPEDAELKVTEIAPKTEEFKQYLKTSAGELSIDMEDVSFARFFDIEIISDGTKIEPQAPVQVKITYKDALELGEKEELNVVHFAGTGTEVIDDVALTEGDKEIVYKQDSFSVTGTIISGNGNPEQQNEYAVVVKHDGKYYAVRADGSLEKVTYNQQQNVANVTMDFPMTWTYRSAQDVAEYEPYVLRMASEAAKFDNFELPIKYSYRYIDPNSDEGIREEKIFSKDEVENLAWDCELRYEESDHSLHGTELVMDGNKYTYPNNGKYIGVSDEGGKLHIVGNQSEGNKAEVYLASFTTVPEPFGTGNTVNHIDISVKGNVEVSVPLAYGTYYYYDDNGQVKTITVSADKPMISRATQEVSVKKEDMMKADLFAYKKNADGSITGLDDMFYVTGYSDNGKADGTDGPDQVRIEGSFKVSYTDVSGVNGNANSRAARLATPVWYSISAPKDVTVPLQYTVGEGENARNYPLYSQNPEDTGEQPLTTKATVSLTADFNYWDFENNTCPAAVRNLGGDWHAGDIPDGRDDDKIHSGSGMDFVLTGNSGSSTQVYAVEITKIVVDENGNRIKSNDAGTSKFHIYRKGDAGNQTELDNLADSVKDLNVGEATETPDYNGYVLQHDNKEIFIGDDGLGSTYEYDVEPGLYYIAEDPDSIKDQITDTSGQQWNYKETYFLTEYAWRDHPNDNKMHVSEKFTGKQGSYGSVPEILGSHPSYDGSEQFDNDFLEYYVYNVYESPKVDVPVEKTWPDFDGDGNDEYDWSATFKLQWAPVYEGERTPSESFEDVTPLQEITITKDQMKDAEARAESLADRTFKDLPKYGTDKDGDTFRYQYSLEETSYQVTNRSTGVVLYSWSETEGYNTFDEDEHYQPFYPHDAGEESDADNDYYIQVRNAQRNIRAKEHIDVSLDKQWDETFNQRDDSYYAEFELKRFVHTEYRDISHMSDVDRDPARAVKVTIQDSEGNEIDSLTVQPNVGVYLAGNFKAHDDAKAVEFTTETPVRLPSGSHVSTITATADGSNQSVALVRSPEFFVTHDTVFTLTEGAENLISEGKIARVLDTSAGTSPRPDQSFSQTIRLDSTNNWHVDLEDLIRSETSAGVDDDNENVTLYEYYFVEKASSPKGYAKYYRADGEGNPTEILSGDADHQIEENDQIIAVNGPANVLTVEKKWRGVPDATGFPHVTFTLYQTWADGGNVSSSDGWVYENEHTGARYEHVELPANSLQWNCPEVLPTTKLDGGRSRPVGYYVVEDVRSGSQTNGNITAKWAFYYYINSDGKQINAGHQGYFAGLTGESLADKGGKITICNAMENYMQMDIQKQFFELGEAGSWGNITSRMMRDAVLGFKVIRAIKAPDGKWLDEGGNESDEPVWMDYGSEMLCGYNENGTPVMHNDNGFNLRGGQDVGGEWHFRIEDNQGDKDNINTGGSGLPSYGYFIRNGQNIAVEYWYSFRETNVYHNLDRDPYPEWDWYSSITPINAYGPNGTMEAFPKAFEGQDAKRIVNFQASDLLIHKQWIGDISASEVYVKLWRATDDGEVEDFTQVIADDVKNNHNWQMYVSDESEIDVNRGWLILKDDGSGEWTSALKVNRALLGTMNGTLKNSKRYHYYIQEVAYKTTDGHIKTNVNAKYKPLYDKWLDGAWTNAPAGMNDYAGNSITIGEKGENQLKVINRGTPSTSYTITKAFDGSNSAAGGQSSVSGRYPTDGSKQVVVELQQRYRYEKTEEGVDYVSADNENWVPKDSEEAKTTWTVGWQGAESASPTSVVLPLDKPAGSTLSDEAWYGSAAAWTYTWEGLDVTKVLAEDSDPTKTRTAKLYYRAVETSTPEWINDVIAADEQDGHEAVDDEDQTAAQILAEENTVTNEQGKCDLKLNKEWTGLGEGKTWPEGYTVDYQLVQEYHLAATDISGTEERDGRTYIDPEYSYGKVIKTVDMVRQFADGMSADNVHTQAIRTIDNANTVTIADLPMYGFFKATEEDVAAAAVAGVTLKEGVTYPVVYTYSVRETSVKKNGKEVAFRPQTVSAERDEAITEKPTYAATLTNEFVNITVEKEWNGLTPGSNESATIGLYRFEKEPEPIPETTFPYTVVVAGDEEALASDGSVSVTVYNEADEEVETAELSADNAWSHTFDLEIGGTYHAVFAGDGTTLQTDVTPASADSITGETATELTAAKKPAASGSAKIVVTGTPTNLWLGTLAQYINGQRQESTAQDWDAYFNGSGGETKTLTGLLPGQEYRFQIGATPDSVEGATRNGEFIVFTASEGLTTITLNYGGGSGEPETATFDPQTTTISRGTINVQGGSLTYEKTLIVGKEYEYNIQVQNLGAGELYQRAITVTGATYREGTVTDYYNGQSGNVQLYITPNEPGAQIVIHVDFGPDAANSSRSLQSAKQSKALAAPLKAPAAVTWNNDATTLPEGANPGSDEKVDEVTLSGSTWSKTWSMLPKYAASGNEYVYYAYETDYAGASGASEMTTTYSIDEDGNLIVTNTPTMPDKGNLEVTKEVYYGNALDTAATGFSFTVGIFTDAAGTTRVTGQEDKPINVTEGTGNAIFTDLDSGTYYVYEVVNGRAVTESGAKAIVDGKTYSVTYQGNNAQVASGQTVHAKVMNTRAPYDLQILKVEKTDGDDPDALQGAEFTLHQLAYNPEAQKPISYVPDSDAVVTTDADGMASFEDLAQGYYEIEETKAPAGYILTEDSTFCIRVTSAGVSLVIRDDSTPPDQWESVDTDGLVTFTAESEEFLATIANEPGTELPNSGGPGTTWIYLIGAILLLGCGISLIARRRVRRGI